METPSTIKLAAFDWNGTLLADTQAAMDAENQVRMVYGYPAVTLKQFREWFTVPIRDYWTNSGLDPAVFDRDEAKIKHLFHDAYEARIRRVRSRAGAKQILHWLQQQGVETMIFSNHIVEEIRKQISRLSLASELDVILANSERTQTGASRSKGAKLATFLSERGLKPEEVMVVGDTNEEVEIAQDLGAIAVALTGGWESTTRLKASRPNYVIGHLSGLEAIVRSRNSA